LAVACLRFSWHGGQIMLAVSGASPHPQSRRDR